jgi:hypothetical protein
MDLSLLFVSGLFFRCFLVINNPAIEIDAGFYEAALKPRLKILPIVCLHFSTPFAAGGEGEAGDVQQCNRSRFRYAAELVRRRLAAPQ